MSSNGQLVTNEQTKEIQITQEPSGMDQLLMSAVDKGLDADSITKLVDLQERMIAAKALSEFNVAMHKFQKLCPVIDRNATGHNNDYATKDHIAKIIRPHLSECGLSYTFDCDLTDGKVKTTCTVSHIGGHSVPVTFNAPIDEKMRANDTQKVASASSYGQRYAMIMAFGLSVGDVDDDAVSAGAESSTVTKIQYDEILALLKSSKANEEKFLKFFGIEELHELSANRFAEAKRMLGQKASQS